MDKSLLLFVGFSCFPLINGVEAKDRLKPFQSILPEDQPYRTTYHFQPPKNWLNDPNGPMYYMGVYHLFYQHNPNGPIFDNGMVWAHSASYDLINWFSLDHALTPSKPFDALSCWSGSVTILPGDQPVILYTGVDANRNQVQNLATPKNRSDPLLTEWVKYSGNPLMTPPNGVDGDNFRDPSTAWRGSDGTWRVVIGSYSNKEGMAILYQSEDFVNWTMHRDPLYSTSKTEMWECLDFFPVSVNSTNGVDTSVANPSVRHVMKASVYPLDYYIMGTYDTEKDRFVPDTDLTGTSSDLIIDYGKFYASKTFFDSKKNRRVIFAWVNESDSSEDDIQKGWSGLQAIPRQIWLDRTGKQLVQWPVEELNSLRDNQVYVNGKQLQSGSVFEVSGITASQADIEIMFQLPELEEAEFKDTSLVDPQLICDRQDSSVAGKYGPFGLLALATKDLTERTAIFFRVFRGETGYVVLMCSDQKRSSLRNNLDTTTYGAFVNIDPRQEMVSLRTFIDHSIIENFGGKGRTSITSRVYPKLAIDDGARLFAFNNGTLGVTISSLHAWSMNKAQVNSRGSLGNTESS